MGASYVTGTRPAGVGSAEKSGMKGPGNGRNQYVSLVSPHVVTVDSVSLSSATVTVTLPQPLPLAASKYSIFTASTAHSSATGVDASGKLSSIIFIGTSTQTVNYTIITKGQGA
jgi:hypothetical protein